MEKLLPEIVVMDVAMPNVNGVEATQQIVNKFPAVKVIALSIHSDEGFVYNMIKAGALGYVLKVSIFDELLKAMQAVSAGHAYLSPEITRMAINIIKKDKTRKSLIEILTEREHKVIKSKWKGKNTKQIALEQHVSSKTIEGNSHKIFTKLNVQSWAEVFHLALQEKIISP